MAAVALAYFDILQGDEAVKARESNVTLFQQIVRMARDKRTGGMASGLDTARAEAHLDNERQRVLIAKNEVARARLALLRAIGLPYEVPVVLTDELHVPETPVPMIEQALDIAEHNRVEVKAQVHRIQAAQLAAQSTMSERLPSLVARGDLGQIGNHWTDTLTTHNIGLVLSVPIFDGGQREGRVQQTRSQYQQEVIRLQDVRSQVGLEVHEAIVTLQSSREQLDISKSGLRAALTEFELARERFVTLQSSNVELTTAQLSLVRARDNALDALKRVHASRVNLARSLGQLDRLY